MLCELYIEALLVDEELVDQVWELWANGNDLQHPMRGDIAEAPPA
jgi:hypothetical protein